MRSVTGSAHASGSQGSPRTEPSLATAPSWKTILVQGVLGAVGSVAAQRARWGGATIIGTVTRESDLDQVGAAVAHAVDLSQEQPGEEIRAYAPEGVHRIIEVAFSENADLDAEIAAPDGVIAA